MSKRYLIRLGLFIIALNSAAAAPRTLDAFLNEGRIQEGLVAFASPKNNAERFSLGVLQTLDGLQKLSAGSCSLGVNQEFLRSGLPFFRLMIPSSATNQVATPAKLTALFTTLRNSLKNANSTLALIDDKEFKVQVNLSKARLDFDGDGIVASDELLMARLRRILGLPQEPQEGRDLVIRFDSADAIWLKGYTHFLIGVLDILMAYDWHPVWNQCAHVIFQNPEPAPSFARFTRSAPGQMFAQWADLIAAVHDMRLELEDKAAFANARKEFLATIACSRVCWQRVVAETDNDYEWLPSPKQTGPAGTKLRRPKLMDGSKFSMSWTPFSPEKNYCRTGG